MTISEQPGRRVQLEFTNNSELLPGSPYRIVNKDGDSERGGLAEAVAPGGGAGEVYRLRFKGSLDYAIKFLNPLADRTMDYDHFSRHFDREVQLLARLTHTHLAKIRDWGEILVGGTEVKYYVMDYIEGDSLRWVWQTQPDPDFDGRAFYEVIDQVLDALEYLHGGAAFGFPVMHTDVHTANILLTKRNDSFLATLADLGTGKVIRPMSPISGVVAETEAPEHTYFVSSRYITREQRRSRLQQPVSQQDINSFFPDQDLHAFGVMLRDVLTDINMRRKLANYLGFAGLPLLMVIRDRLLQDPPYYTNNSDSIPSHAVTQLRNDWRKLAPSYLSPLGIDELAPVANVDAAISLPRITPLSHRLGMTQRLGRVINHQLFQRLRDISQLEFVYLVNPGARHSRLTHSLATFDIARQYLLELLNDATFRISVEPHEIEATLIWALLHDIGHYPLSHMFEDFGAAQEGRAVPEERRIPNDDDLFWSFVDPEGEHPLTSLYAPRIADTLGDIVRRTGVQSSMNLSEALKTEFSSQCLDSTFR